MKKSLCYRVVLLLSVLLIMAFTANPQSAGALSYNFTFYNSRPDWPSMGLYGQRTTASNVTVSPTSTGFSLSGPNGLTTYDIPTSFPFSNVFALTINDRGQVAGNYSQGNSIVHYFFWDKVAFTLFEGSSTWIVFGLNNNGTLISGTWFGGFGEGATWNGGILNRIHIPESSWNRTNVISDSEWIGGITDQRVEISPGFWHYEEDYFVGVPATSVSEPATMLLLGSGLVGLIGLRRKLKR